MFRRRRLDRTLVVTLAAVVFATEPVLATTAHPSPKALYKALLASRIPKSQLPAGYHSSKTRAVRIGAGPRRWHAVGQLAVDLDDGNDATIVYVVFPTSSDALDNFAYAVKEIKTHKSVTVKLVARGLPKPSVVLSASGLTQVSFIVRNVGVNAISTRGRPSALTLAKLGLEHLNAVAR
jgi:hypothetical protein